VVTVLRVAEDEELLGYLGDIGMRPGVLVEVVAAEPFSGPLTVRIAGTSRALAREVARFVVVESA
jgi:Fe2+ transport system protein FeoA